MSESDVAYLDTMNEVLEMTAQFVEEARHVGRRRAPRRLSQDGVALHALRT